MLWLALAVTLYSVYEYPVSYTHLDVYKRQERANLLGYSPYEMDEMGWALYGADCVFNTVPSRVILKRHTHEVSKGCLYPVSYTHLQVDLDAASEFLSMAATLLYIKSRSLLPKQVVEPDVEEEKQRLIQNLYEYRRLKEAAETMATLETGALEHYYKLPDEYMYTENEVVLEGLRVEDLYAGFLEILRERELRTAAPQPVAMVRHRAMPVVQKVGEIRRRLRREGNLLFTELFPPEAEKRCV